MSLLTSLLFFSPKAAYFENKLLKPLIEYKYIKCMGLNVHKNDSLINTSLCLKSLFSIFWFCWEKETFLLLLLLTVVY